MERRRELLVGVAIVLLVAGGISLDAWGDPVEAPPPTSEAENLIHQRALFCPPSLKNTEGETVLTTWSSSGEQAAISLGDEGDEEPRELASDSVLSQPLEGTEAVDVVGSGAPLLANVSMSFTKPFAAAGAAQCSAEASSTWYFPEGSSDIGFRERLLIYNPFPDEAVVRISFVSRNGVEAKASLANVAVPSGESVEIPVWKRILQRPALASVITTARGRVVAWRMMLSNAEDRNRGAEFSLGATHGSTRLFFPLGKVDDGSQERITILNPSDETAEVTVTLLTKDGVVPAPDLVEKSIRAGDTQVFDLSKLGGKRGPPVGPLSARIESVNGVGVIAEQSLEFGSAGFDGVASDFGIAETASSWWVGPPATGTNSQDALTVLNLGSKVASVDVTLLSDSGERLSPNDMQGVEIPAGRRGQILVPEGGPFVALVESDQEVVVARVAQTGDDVSVLNGVPIKPTRP